MATKIIALDAGHGMKTAGKRTPDGIHEWEMNDKVRDKIVTKLKDYDVKFIFPDNNEGSKDESLTSRRTMYVNAKVDAAVSIHHNAFQGKWGNHTGVCTFVDRACTSKDMELAKCIQKRLPKYTGLRDRGIEKANFSVIYQNKVPAVLTEGGFMDSKIDYPVITSDEGQDAYSKAVAEGLIEFLNLKKKKAITVSKEKKESFKPYLVKITAKTLNVRKGAGTKHKVVTKVKKGEVYTIVDVKMNGKTKWGLLKSGVENKDMWISMNYAKKV